MFIILGVSIIALAIFLERAAYLYFRMNLNMDKAYKKVLYTVEKRDFREALEECSRIE